MRIAGTTKRRPLLSHEPIACGWSGSSPVASLSNAGMPRWLGNRMMSRQSWNSRCHDTAENSWSIFCAVPMRRSMMRGCVAMHAPVKERDCTVQRGASHPVGQRAGRDQRPISHLTMVCSTLLLVSLALSACSGGSTSQAPTGAAKPGAVPVVVATAVQKTVPLQIRTIGTVEAIASVEVKVQVGGEIIQVAFQEGQDVRAGELLFRIDTRPYEAELRRAEANLARDMAQQKQAEANLARDILQAQNAQVEARRRAHLL